MMSRNADTDTQDAAFIIGAPRCGTTAMARYLGSHPQICLSRPKETHFFIDPLPRRDPGRARAVYLARHFRHCADATRLLLDASVSYLYEPEVARRALALFPGARFIVMLRNPLHMLPSYHQRLLYTMQERESDFARAWALQERRRQGRSIPLTCSDRRLLFYGEVGRLGHHLKNFIAVCGRQRCLPLLLDDLEADPLVTYRRALAFLGLDYDGRTSFPPKNPRRRHRNAALQLVYSGAIFMPLLPMGSRSSLFYDRFRRYTRPLRRRLRRRNIEPAPPDRLPEALQAELSDYFRADIDLLGQLTGRDLSAWLEPAPDTSVDGKTKRGAL